MSYRKLEVWQLAKDLAIDIHQMSMELPKFEMYETGSQIRRASKSVKSNLVEGYGRRYYKSDYIKFIIYALASNDETLDHLDILYETGSLKDKNTYQDLRTRIEYLGKKLTNFLKSVKQNHRSPK